MDRWAIVAACVVLGVNAVALATVRWGWSTKLTALALGTSLNLIIFFLSFYSDGEPLLLAAWSFVNVVIVTYLVGSRSSGQGLRRSPHRGGGGCRALGSPAGPDG